MSEQPELGMRRDAVGVHAIGSWSTTSATARWSTGMAGRCGLWSPSRPRATSEPTLRDLTKRSSPCTAPTSGFTIHVDLALHRHDAPAAAYRADGSCSPATRRTFTTRPWAGSQPRCAGCCESGMEAGSGGQRDSPESLLDTYHDERHPVAARALKHTMRRRRCSARTSAQRLWPTSLRSWR